MDEEYIEVEAQEDVQTYTDDDGSVIKNPPHRPIRTILTPQQVRYANLKVSTKLSNAKIAEILGIHVNTTTNWNKNPLVIAEIENQIEIVRKDNMIGMQRLMGSLIREASEVLDDEEVGSTLKIQLIGQLFSQAGKFAGLEPPKQVNKKVEVKKSFEQLLTQSETVPYEDI